MAALFRSVRSSKSICISNRLSFFYSLSRSVLNAPSTARFYSSSPVTQHPQGVKDDIPHTTSDDVSERIKRSLDDDDGRAFNEGEFFDNGSGESTTTTTAGRKESRRNRSVNEDESTAGFVADKAKSGLRKGVEMAFNIGEAAAETMEGSWGVAKKTTKKIRETVLGSEDDGKEDQGGRTRRRGKKTDSGGDRAAAAGSPYSDNHPKRQGLDLDKRTDL